MLRLDLFNTRKEPPRHLRITVAVYPDGREIRIARAPNLGAGMWFYDRDMAAGPGKRSAVQSALSHGARIEQRTVPNPAHRGR